VSGALRSAAQAVGLAVSNVSERTMVGWSFPAFRRELAEPSTPDAKTTTWAYGQIDGVSVLVRERTLFSRRAVIGRSEVREADPYTSVLVELDPPIFAGLRVFPLSIADFVEELPSGIELAGTDLRQWAAYDVHDAERATLLLREVGAALAEAQRRACICVHDGMLEVLTRGEPAANSLSHDLSVAVPLAKLISAHARALPERPWEAAVRSAWLAAASALGLSFDPVRWHVHGLVGSVRVEAIVESGPSGIYTAVRAFFKVPLGCGVYIRRGQRLDVGWFAWISDPTAWTKKGAPDLGPDLDVRALQMDRLVELFAIGDVREKIVDALSDALVLALHDHEIVVGFSGALGADALTAAIERLVAAVEAFAPARNAGPYR
jgi:hypothetical protein